MEEKKYNILLAEDDESLQKALTKVLRKEGYSVYEASNGEEALTAFNQKAFDLVITDLSMPKKKGLEVAAEVKKKNAAIPVIIITAFGDWDTYKDAIDRDVFEYVNKPVKKEELLKIVENALLCKEHKGIPTGPNGFI